MRKYPPELEAELKELEKEIEAKFDEYFTLTEIRSNYLWKTLEVKQNSNDEPVAHIMRHITGKVEVLPFKDQYGYKLFQFKQFVGMFAAKNYIFNTVKGI